MFFLSRPRRFGKSLLVSTLAALFKGEKKLFKETWIGKSAHDWKSHPVISLDFSGLPAGSPEQLRVGLVEYLAYVSEEMGVTPPASEQPSHILRVLIDRLAAKGFVVILIDEYDRCLVSNLGDEELTREIRRVFQDLFVILKTLQGKLRFVLLTGVTKFSKVSLFSGLNSLIDLSLDPKYSTLLGLTEEEIRTTFAERLQALAATQKSSVDQLIEGMRQWYNGYSFDHQSDGVRVYNPWSVLSYLQFGVKRNYWYESGTPSFAIDLIQKKKFDFPDLEQGVQARDEINSNFQSDGVELVPLLYQSGYLTINQFDEATGTYTLKFPNEEVRRSFLEGLFASLPRERSVNTTPSFTRLREAFYREDLSGVFEAFDELLASIPFHLHSPEERYYHSLLYLCFRIGGFFIDAEVATSRGRIDMVASLPEATYIFEVKVDQSARRALAQIRDSDDARRFTSEGKRVVLVGANFSTKSRSITDWKQEVFKVKS